MVPGYDVTTWYGLFGPKGMPPAVIAKLNKTLNEMLRGARGPRAPGQDRRGGEKLDAGSIRTSSWLTEYKKWSKVREKAGLASSD